MMKLNRRSGIVRSGFFLAALLFSAHVPAAFSQYGKEVKWLKIGSLHQYFLNWGAEYEIGRTGQLTDQMDGLRWPAQFPNQDVLVGKAMWAGCTDFRESNDSVYTHKVIIIGPRGHDEYYQFIPAGFRLIGRFDHPRVYVDGIPATDNELNDVVDEIDPDLPCDRMLVNRLITPLGVTITRRAMQFAQENHDNYLVYDYVFKNTGVTDLAGTQRPQTLNGVYFHFQYRYGSGQDVFRRGGSVYPSNNISWGRNCVNQVVGIGPRASDFELRAQYSWYGPHSASKAGDDWGCPNILTGQLAGVHYMGTVILHADASAKDHSDDRSQPGTTMFVPSNKNPENYAADQYNATLMRSRYDLMAAGHPDQTHADQVGDGFADLWGSDEGGYSQGQGFGPYDDFAPGDSIHLVIAEGVSGISREKSMAVGRNWFLHYTHQGDPVLTLPNGSVTTDAGEYKKLWVQTGEDSILQTFRRAAVNYESQYRIPLPPPPPDVFEVNSGGDRIILTWSASAESDGRFDGYEIYRAVNRPDTLYERIFSCGASDRVNRFEDRTAQRGFDYYYYIVTKDDGSLNDVHPGVPLRSSKFYTMTSEPAYLRKAAVKTTLDSIRVVPNPFYIGAAALQFGSSTPDRLAFFGLPPECIIRIYTERGDLVNTIVHDDGTADELWDSLTSSRQIIVSGVYIAYFEVTRDLADPATGALLFRKGDRAIRKFFVLR
ncbi:hypothetical protein JW906_04465 [bacterium]|nr:hypothetical protein [bacterium]